MNDQTNNFGEIAKRALTNLQNSPEQQSTGINSARRTEMAKRRKTFTEWMVRWGAIFAMSQRPSQAEMTIMMEEYYLALGNLSPDGMRELTDQLKAKCKWFPSIAECLELITPKSYQNPFYCSSRLFYSAPDPEIPQIAYRHVPELE